MRVFNFSIANIKDSIKSMVMFYSIYAGITYLIGLLFRTKFTNPGTGTMSTNLFFAATIYLFILGIGHFIEGFKLSQAINITRSEFWRSIMLTSIIIGAIFAALELVNTLLASLFKIVNYTLYNGMYLEFSKISQDYGMFEGQMTIKALSLSFILSMLLFSSVILLGVFVGQSYYRTNKYIRIAISIAPLLLIFLVNQFVPGFWRETLMFVSNILGVNSNEPIKGIITFFGLFLGLGIITRLLIVKLSLNTK